MPVYEYYCESCDKVYEFVQRISDPPKETCEVCQGHLKKQISLSSFHLKGSGWYVTDYGGKNKNGNGAATSKDGEDKPAAKEDKKETKDKKIDSKSTKESKSSSASDTGK